MIKKIWAVSIVGVLLLVCVPIGSSHVDSTIVNENGISESDVASSNTLSNASRSQTQKSYEWQGIAWYYYLTNGNAILNYCISLNVTDDTKLILPGVVEDKSGRQYNVIGISSHFSTISQTLNTRAIQYVFIPNNIEVIYDAAFSNLSNLKKVEFEAGSKLKQIGNRAFMQAGVSYSNYIPAEDGGSTGVDYENTVEMAASNWKYVDIQAGSSGSLDYVVKLTDPTGAQVVMGDTLSISVKDAAGNSYEQMVGLVSFKVHSDASVGTITISDLSRFAVGQEVKVLIMEAVTGNTLAMLSFNFVEKTSPPEDVGDLPDYFQIVIPASVQKIGSDAFLKLAKVTFEEDSMLQSIGDRAFRNLKFPVVIPARVSSIGAMAFNPNVAVSIDSNNSAFLLDSSGNLLTRDRTTLLAYYGSESEYSIPQGVTVVGDYAIADNNSITKIVIPAGMDWGIYPYWNLKQLRDVEFANDLTRIPDYLLGRTAITELTIPSWISSIGEKSIFDNDSLESVSFDPNSHLTYIGKYAFVHNLKLKTVSFASHEPGYSCTIDDGAFFWCNDLTVVNVPDAFCIKSIGNAAFAKENPSKLHMSAISFGDVLTGNGTQMKGIMIPASVEYIGVGAFSATAGSVASSQEGLGQYVISGNPVMTGNLDASGYTISFKEGSLITTIGVSTFAGLYGVKSIDLRNCLNLTSIEGYAFRNTYDSSSFKGTQNGITDIHLPNSIKSIGDLAFYRQAPLPFDESLVLPASITVIGDSAFYHCFTTISFDNGSQLKTIGRTPLGITHEVQTDLSNCLVLEEVSANRVILPPGVYSIAIPSGVINSDKVVTSIGSDGTVNIGPGIIAISDDVLKGASSFTVDPGNDLFHVSNGCLYFDGVSYELIAMEKSRTELTIGADSKVMKIHAGAFAGSELKTLEISKQGVIVRGSVFSGCENIESVILDSVNTMDFDRMSFSGSVKPIKFYVPSDIESEKMQFLQHVGTVTLGYLHGGAMIYLPLNLGDESVVYIGMSVDGGVFSANMSISGGYTLHDVAIQVNGSPIGTGMPLSFEVISGGRYYVTLAVRESVQYHEVIFDGSGGSSNNHNRISVMIGDGRTILDSDIPIFVKEGGVLMGWKTLSGEEYDFDKPVTRGFTIKAVWGDRGPVITLDVDAGDVYCDDAIVKSISADVAKTYVLKLSPYNGYEIGNWIRDGVELTTATEPLSISNIETDTKISVSYVYYSTSSGLNPLTNRGLPTTEELDSTVKAWSVGGYVDMSGMFWLGHSSVPLIVDDFTYLRIGASLYKIESDTGYVAAKVGSVSVADYYHQLGYGRGLIIDYATNMVFDIDLEPQFTLSTKVAGLEYYDGYFYSSGSTMYRFPADTSKAVDGVMPLEKVGVFDKSVYSSYGFATSVFKNGYVYRVYAEGNDRGITAMCVDDSSADYGRSNSVVMPMLNSMYLDDGWVSSYMDYIYIPGYTEGLFGAVAKNGYDVLAYVKVDGLNYGAPKYYVFGEKGDSVDASPDTTYGGHSQRAKTFTSQFVVSRGIGYIVAGSLHAFEMNPDGSLGQHKGQSHIALSHGSITLDTSYATEENGYTTYVYMIPYYSSQITMAAVKCYTNPDGEFVMERTISNNYETNYNSQAIRAGLDGRMIWYNDSGWVHSYTTPEKNRYFVFIQDGSGGRWYESTGASAHQAFSKLGSNVLTLGQFKEIRTVNGHDADDFRLYAIRYGSVSESVYAQPVEIQNLSDSSNNMYHYYVITDAEGVPAQGTVWKYLDGSGLKDYQFKYNIGDRDLIGVSLVLPGSDAYIEFYDGDDLVGKVLGAVGSTTRTIDTPDISKDGKALTWDGIPDTFAPGTTRVAARWVNTMDAEVSFEDGMCHVFSEVKKQSEYPEGVRMVLIHEYGDNVAWAFTPVVWGDDSLYRYMSSLSSAGLTSVTVMLVEGSSYKDCRMLAIAECDLGVRGDRT